MPSPRVIVVGASAGGLDALTAFLGAVDAGLPWCFVVAQHVAPSGSSTNLAHILARATALTVVEAVDGDSLRSRTVFVAPPGHNIVVGPDAIGIEVPDAEHRPWPSIDKLFLSAARAFGEQSVAVVLSGSGDDGAAGVEAIETAGGVVAIQEIASAAYESMPSVSFSTGSVDIQAPAGDIAHELQRFIGDPDATTGSSTRPRETDVGHPLLNDIAAVLLNTTGVDFSGYKTSTLRRQITRRQRLLAVPNGDAYAALLQDNPEEIAALARSLLVTVTAFFRDRDVWEGLRSHLRTAFAESDNRQFRIWVPGCASGEEAYTVAMLAADSLDAPHDDLSSRLKIFATDLDEHALDSARTGRFPSLATEAIPAELRTRWMRPAGDRLEVVPALRETIVFARHNVAFDPPFPNLDLVSLRNTLIYFQPRLQERVLQLCHFALAPNGLLLLGQSERVPRTDEMFVAVDDERRLYRRRQHSRLTAFPLARGVSAATISRRQPSLEVGSTGANSENRFYRDVLKAVVPAALILDDRSVLIEVVGDVAPWCMVNEGVHNGNVIDLLKPEYRSAVAALLSQLRHSSPKTAARSIRTVDGTTQIAVTRTDSGTGATDTGAIVTFDARPDIDEPPGDTVNAEGLIGVELESVYQALEATVADLSSANEELQALNEELQASSEELQASSEEVQASNEELEATNEELTKLNNELAQRSAEATRANVDLENIQTSLTNGLVLLDSELRITRFTALAVRLFSLIPSDIGRHLTSVPTTIPVPELGYTLQATLADGSPRIIEPIGGERDFLVQTQAYRDDRRRVIGAIVMVIDVSDITAEKRSRERALANLEVVTESIEAIVWQRDKNGTLNLLTSRVEELYGLDRTRVLADPSLLMTVIHPDDRERVATTSASADEHWQMRYRIVRPDGSVRWIDESASVAHPRDGSPSSRIGTAFDVTEQELLAALTRDQTELLSTLFASTTLGILLVDGNRRIVRASDAVSALTGFEVDALVGRRVSTLLSASSGENGDGTDQRIVSANGRHIPVAVEVLVGGEGELSVMIVHDSSQLRSLSAELAAHEQFDQQTGLLTRNFFRTRASDLVTANSTDAAVLWVDLDGFKEVNDRLGHRSGDVVLGVVAKRLQRAVREHHLVGRLGGDEFAVLLGRADDLDSLDNTVHRILTAIREPITIDDSQAFVSASIGVAVQPQDGNTADELLHNADVAMYSAKKSGRDQHVYFTKEMDRNADARAALRHELATAVRNRSFELHYQPIRHRGTGDIAMIEALVRWRRDGQLVSAGEFIGLAAETGQLRALGHIVLDCLFADMETLYNLLGQDHPRVAVNMSASELRERDLVDRLLAWHPAAGFDKVVVEVTEQVTLVPGDRAFDSLAVLRRLGATISIDDFGTGYSSLELLGKLKPGIIKIDRSLTESAAVDGRGARILDAAVNLAHALETVTVIEGVGTAELSAVADRTGAELVQGYHLGVPQPLSDVIELFTAKM